jgi:beta-N-acetylhexosaminidase
MTAGRLMLDLTGIQLVREEAEILQHPAVGGVILFSRNIESADQVGHLCGTIRALRPELLLAVDQEGGRVQRLKEGFTRLPPLRQLGCLYDLDRQAGLQASRLLGQLMASEVLEAGLDLSFAPVLDLDYGRSEVIGDRAFAADSASLIALAETYIIGMHEAGMAAVGKHYPGHGYVSADSHTSLPVDQRSLEDIRSSCLQPFSSLARKLQGIMPAHVIYTALDEQPAGFSQPWLNLLRQELGFTGMIFSDDLAMQAAAVAGSYPQRAEAALSAGCDQLLVCNNRPAALEVLEWMDVQQLNGSEKAAALRANMPSNSNWQQSPEALLARQVAESLVNHDLQTALHALSSL